MDEIKKIAKFMIVAIGGVLFWRGAWIACDIYLFPNNIELSMLVSLVTGLIIIFTTDYKNF